MKVLQLCGFTNRWGKGFQVENVDTKLRRDVLDLDDEYGKAFDFIIAGPPCTQFTKANNRNWLEYPEMDVRIAKKCLQIAIISNKDWILENPPGRITRLIPDLKKYRIGTWKHPDYTKKYVIYSNRMWMLGSSSSQGGIQVPDGKDRKTKREMWTKEFINDIKNQLTYTTPPVFV